MSNKISGYYYNTIYVNILIIYYIHLLNTPLYTMNYSLYNFAYFYKPNY